MSISKLINKAERNHTFEKVISNNAVLQNFWRYLKANLRILAVGLTALFCLVIYLFGKNVGEFCYYITH